MTEAGQRDPDPAPGPAPAAPLSGITVLGLEQAGYGRGGPLDHKRAYDLLVQAEAGSCAITGLPGQSAKPGIPIADVGTAFMPTPAC